MNIIKLRGVDEDTENTIIDHIKNPDTVFVYMGKEKLYSYIDELGDLISSKNLCRIKICKEIEPIDVTLVRGEKKSNFSKLSDLLAAIDAGMYQEVVIKGNISADEEKVKAVRTQLSDIVQQFVYLNISLDKVQVMTEKEYQDNAKVRQFSNKIREHQKNLIESKKMLSGETFHSYREIADEVGESLKRIGECLEDAQDNELKIAAAASKKSGKSVIVNSMLKCEVAPTSLELATPNNCIYRKSDRGYTLEYDGKKRQFSSEKEIREYIYEIFKTAEMDKQSGYAVPDMNIGYISSDQGISTYTIYDTPGPDLAGADGHKKAAFKAINEVDVIIFVIDYSKYLTDSEVDYLKKIRDSFSEKNKFYSLILDVNKLDCRYGNEGDKSSIRILDFIRNKLVSIAPEFKDTIVIGTSALTYFNCIEMEKIAECADLGKHDSFRDDLETLIEDFSDDKKKCDEVNAMQFISNMIGNIKTFDGIRVKEINEIKKLSGMPDLLSYVEYIARNKARVEKVNNLIYKIESEYARIQNFFHFQQLEESLAENQELLEQAKKVLSKFSEEVGKIYNEGNHDFCEMWGDNGNGFKSQSLKAEGNRSPFEFEKIFKYCQEVYIDEALDENRIIEDIKSSIRNSFEGKIRKLFRDSEHTLERKVIKKNGTDCTEAEILNVVEEEKVKLLLQRVCSEINESTRNSIESHIKYAKGYLKNESELILEDLEKIVHKRRQRLEKAVRECREGLREECGIDFKLVLPKFEYSFRSDSAWEGGEKISIDMKSLVTRIGDDIDDEMTKKGKVHNNWLFNLFGKVIGSEYNKLSYDEKYVMAYYDKRVAPEIENFLRKANIAGSYKEEKEAYISELEDYVKYIQDEMKDQSKIAMSYAHGIEGAIDQTSEEYEGNIDGIMKKQQTLEIIQRCVKKFCDVWGEGR